MAKRKYINADDALDLGLNLEVAPYDPKEVTADKDGKYVGLNGTTIDDMDMVGTGQYINVNNWDKLGSGYSIVNNPYQAASPDQVAKRQQGSQVSTGTNDMELMGDDAYNRILQYQQEWADAKARGDQAAMDAAHAAAEEERAKYGYSGGADGSEHLGLMAYTGDVSGSDNGRGNGGWGYDPYLSKYQARIDALADAILNRDPFSYDKDKDPLYQQYKESYTRGGQRGMQDTLAQVSARTGGLASSYAQTAAQQTYNNYMAELANKVPELYQLAYSMYMDDIAMDRADLSMLQGLDDTAYGRWSDDRNFDYGMYRDNVADSQWQQQFDYQQQQDALAQQNYLNEQSQAASDTAYDRAMQMLLMGVNPGADMLGAAGIGNDLAQSIIGMNTPTASGGGLVSEKPDAAGVMETIYGIKDEAMAYDYLVSQGLSATEAENYMNYWHANQQEQEQEETATAANRHDDDGVTISRVGKVSWSKLAELVEKGDVREIYDPEKNSYWYEWIGG